MQTQYSPLNKESTNNNFLKRKEKALSENPIVCGKKDVYSTASKSPCGFFVLKAKIDLKKITILSPGKQSLKMK